MGWDYKGKINQRWTRSTLQPSDLFLDIHAKGWSWMKLKVNDKKMGGFFFPLKKRDKGVQKASQGNLTKYCCLNFKNSQSTFKKRYLIINSLAVYISTM